MTIAPPPPAESRWLGLRISRLSRRRLANFRANRRGWWSTWIFLGLFAVTLPAEFVANDRPLLVWLDGQLYTPALTTYAETDFGGEFETEADYRDPYFAQLLAHGKGWALWPLIRYGNRTVNFDLRRPAPSPPSADNWLGTDDQARDVLARLIYGFRISVLFGLCLTFFSSLIGIAAGLMSFVPYFGMLIGLAIAVAIAVVQFGAWQPVLLVLAVFAVGQLLESIFLTPKFVGDKVRLHAVWVIFALMVGGALFGFTGILLAIPVAATIGVVVRFVIDQYLDSALYKNSDGDPS